MSLFPGHIREALERWSDFPVHQEPRPIVLVGLPLEKREELKDDAQLRARFDGPADPELELPQELLADASKYCVDVQTGVPGPLARIIRGVGPFGTDRGISEFPAWMMFPRNRRWPFIRMDPEFERQMTWWPEGLVAYGDEVSMLADDGRTLTYRFTGTPAAYASYPRAEVFETETAVLVEPVEVSRTDPDAVRLSYSEEREVVVRLGAPLGNRVLIWCAHGPGSETFGSPRTVITSGQAD
jgi:hypothetical protein